MINGHKKLFQYATRRQGGDRVESSCEVSADVGCPSLGFSLTDSPGSRR